ncbi:MAG: ATP synthase F0 subunit C [Lachnospiraceae bacterium]|nr:ATP synthase F0 subunit C [Lachnospiraceae bacterium]
MTQTIRMNVMIKKMLAFAILVMAIATFGFAITSHAAGNEPEAAVEQTISSTESGADTGSKAMAAGLVVGLAAAAGAIGMGIAVAKSGEGISRQPEAAGEIRGNMMLGLVFIETAIIYALIVAILIIFVM